MNIILLTKGARSAGSVNIGPGRSVLLLVFLFLLLPFLALAGGYFLGQHRAESRLLPREWQAELQRQRQEIAQAARRAREDMNGLAVRLGQLQAQAVRLNALGQRLVEVGHLDRGEFDFTAPPAQGGPAGDAASSQQMEPPDFLRALDDLAAELSDRERKLRVMESIFMNRSLQAEVLPAGRPIKKGWISSYFGMRTDPFTGLREFHKGMDFAGKLGSEVVAVASGVVTWAGERYGYGRLVEINHGNGYVTRYGHGKELLVKVGDIVEKGQVIALMGSSGRSTGPHVHFEVHYKGKVVDPAKYLVAAR